MKHSVHLILDEGDLVVFFRDKKAPHIVVGRYFYHDIKKSWIAHYWIDEESFRVSSKTFKGLKQKLRRTFSEL